VGIRESDDTWRWEPVEHLPDTRAVSKETWPDLMAALTAYGCQVRGYRPRDECPPQPQVIFESGPFQPLVNGAYRGWKARYQAEPPTLTINLRWWRWADRIEREGALASLPEKPLLTQPFRRWHYARMV